MVNAVQFILEKNSCEGGYCDPIVMDKRELGLKLGIWHLLMQKNTATQTNRVRARPRQNVGAQGQNS